MKIILTGMVGALIGYITNWLAIKMIFRPHKAIYVGKFKVPFTPGLIPKEKSRIARSVGDAVGKHLLNPETIQEYLCGSKVDGALKRWMHDKIEALRESKTSLGALLKETMGNEYEKFRIYVDKHTKKYLINKIREESTRDKISKVVKEEFIKLLDVNVGTVTGSEIFIKLENHILEKIKGVKNSDNIDETISEAVLSFVNDEINNSKQLNEIIPKDTQESIYDFVENSRDDICQKITNALEKENVKEKMIQSIDGIVSTKLSPMIAMFIKGETVYPMVVNSIKEYLEEDENKLMVSGLLNQEIQLFMNNTVGGLVDKYGEERIKSIISQASDVILNNFVNDDTIEKLFRNFMNSIDENISIRDFIMKLNKDTIEDVEKYIDDLIVKLFEKKEIEEYINKGIEKFIGFIEKVQLDEIIAKNQGIEDSLENGVVTLYQNFMKNNSEKITKTINVAKIVEVKINEFEMDEMEDIILEIANKELKAITWFGALLGLIMGLVSSVLGSI